MFVRFTLGISLNFSSSRGPIGVVYIYRWSSAKAREKRQVPRVTCSTSVGSKEEGQGMHCPPYSSPLFMWLLEHFLHVDTLFQTQKCHSEHNKISLFSQFDCLCQCLVCIACIHTSTHTYVHVETRGQCQLSSSITLHLFSKTQFLTEPGAHHFS